MWGSIPYVVPKYESTTADITTISRPQLPQELKIQQQRKDVTSYGPPTFAAQAKPAIEALEVQGQPRQIATPVRTDISAEYKHVMTRCAISSISS